jgi:hypothetical protein
MNFAWVCLPSLFCLLKLSPNVAAPARHSFVYCVAFILSAWLHIHLYVCPVGSWVTEFLNEVSRSLGRVQTSDAAQSSFCSKTLMFKTETLLEHIKMAKKSDNRYCLRTHFENDYKAQLFEYLFIMCPNIIRMSKYRRMRLAGCVPRMGRWGVRSVIPKHVTSWRYIEGTAVVSTPPSYSGRTRDGQS